MSGRIRSIKPEWLEDEKLVLASSDARVLSIALILLADDYGNGRANRVMLAGRVFPGKVIETLDTALAELAGWFVVLYEVNGQQYFHLPNWDKHQKVDKPGKPRVPPPSAVLGKVLETVANPPENLEKPLASRASAPGPDPDTGPAPDPGHAPAASEPAAPPPLPELAEKAKLWADERDLQRAAAEGPQPEAWPECVFLETVRAQTFKVTPQQLRRWPDPRVKAMLQRFAENYSVQQLAKAIRGAALDDHIQRNPQFQTLHNILKDAAQVDRFMAIADKPPRPKPAHQRHGPVQQTGTNPFNRQREQSS